mgnify:CR=1 FL=1
MRNLHFDIRDLFRAIRLGWSGKKIWTGLCGLLVAYVLYTALVTVGYSMSGTSTGDLWGRYGLFPGAAPKAVGGIGALLHMLAMILAGVVFFITSSMMCKVTYQQLRGDDFYTSGEAWSFIKEHWGGVVFGPIACTALFALFVVAGIIIGWLAGVIPVVGELAFAVGFIPILFAALVAVFMVFAIVAALVMSPAIVGTVGEDALEVVIQSFSICWSQPWRAVVYLIWTAISVWLGATILSGLMTAAMNLVVWAAGMFMGGKLVAMLAVAQGYMPPIDFTFPALRAFPEMKTFWHVVGDAEASGALLWSGRILALMLILLTGVLFAYVQAAVASGTSLIYVILRYKKDDDNMLEWEDLDFDDFDFEEDVATDSEQSASSDSGGGGESKQEDGLEDNSSL